MAYFQEDEARPIVTAWIEQGFEIDRGYILEALQEDEKALGADTAIAGVAAFGSIASGCLMLALAGFSFPMFVPVAVLAGAGLSAWNSDCAKADRDLEAKFLKTYPAVFDRIQQRINAGEDASKVGAEYGQLFRSYRKNDRAALRQLIQTTEQGERDNAIGTPQSVAQTVLEGERDTAIGHSADASKMVTAAAPSIQHITSPVWNPAQDLGENPQSALIVGTPGSGKGMLVSNAVRVLRQKHSALTVMMIDPKADAKERGYWSEVVDRYEAFSLMSCPDPDDGAEWLLRQMDDFNKLPSPKLLIFDEMLAASTELSMAHKDFKAMPRLKKFIAGIVAQGDSQGVWIWAMSQSVQVQDLGISGGVRGNLRAIGLVSPKNTTAIEGLTSTQLIPKPPGGMDELRQIMEASPVKRAVFDGKISRWLPMPKLENHSGFDRDSAKWDKSTPEKRSPSPSIAPPPSSETTRLSVGQVNWERLKVGSLAYPEATDAIDVETTAIDDQPDGLEDFPLVLTIWEYLNGKDPRSIKQISDSMKAKGKIPEEVLRTKLGGFETYKDAIKTVVSFGVSKGYLKQISDDAYEAVRK
jgi:hypothetical protein